jgi:hypothetical protein
MAACGGAPNLPMNTWAGDRLNRRNYAWYGHAFLAHGWSLLRTLWARLTAVKA